jgi:hypothetical protein
MGLAMDRLHRRLFAACDGQLAVIDADNGRLVAAIPTGGHSDENAFDAGTGLIFMPNEDGKGLVIVREDAPDRYTVVQTLRDSVLMSNRIVVDERTHQAFMPHRVTSGANGFDFLVIKPLP